tara:strand:- start:34 stop:273 length:240 start_codon:yes stop_codon:yes gene_type:complete
MVEKVKPVTQIYKKTDLNKEDRRKFIKRVFLDWKTKRAEKLMTDQVVIKKYDPERQSYSVWTKSSETKSGNPYMKKKNG